MSKKRVLIVANMSKPGVGDEIERLRPWLAQRSEIVAVVDILGEAPGGEVGADLCVVFGGDGTLMAAARRLAPAGVPLIGVNMGKLGFLADFGVDDLRKHLDDVLAGRVRPTERMMLHVSVGNKREGFSSLAANDVAIAAGDPFRMIELTVAQGDDEIATYMGDGVLVATPTGSTGYNLSAGGPILDPALQAVVITPVAPHTLTMRPIVVRAGGPIRITSAKLNPGTTLVIDGQVSTALTEGAAVHIRRADCSAKIIPNPEWTFFGRLTSKLQWGRSPHHT